jgi:hypothetical protein
MSALDKAKGLWGTAAAVQGDGEGDKPKHDPNMLATADAYRADALTWDQPEGQDLGDMVFGTAQNSTPEGSVVNVQMSSSWPKDEPPSRPGEDAKRFLRDVFRVEGFKPIWMKPDSDLPPDAS